MTLNRYDLVRVGPVAGVTVEVFPPERLPDDLGKRSAAILALHDDHAAAVESGDDVAEVTASFKEAVRDWHAALKGPEATDLRREVLRGDAELRGEIAALEQRLTELRSDLADNSALGYVVHPDPAAQISHSSVHATNPRGSKIAALMNSSNDYSQYVSDLKRFV